MSCVLGSLYADGKAAVLGMLKCQGFSLRFKGVINQFDASPQLVPMDPVECLRKLNLFT